MPSLSLLPGGGPAFPLQLSALAGLLQPAPAVPLHPPHGSTSPCWAAAPCTCAAATAICRPSACGMRTIRDCTTWPRSSSWRPTSGEGQRACVHVLHACTAYMCPRASAACMYCMHTVLRACLHACVRACTCIVCACVHARMCGGLSVFVRFTARGTCTRCL